MAQEFTDSNINDIIASGKPVIIDFGLHGVAPAALWVPSLTNSLRSLKDKSKSANTTAMTKAILHPTTA